MHNPLHGTFARLRPSTILLEAIGLPVLAGLTFLWLQIPDSHAWQFIFSVVAGLALLLAFLWTQTTVLRRIRSAHQTPIWRAMTLLALWSVIWYFLTTWVGTLTIHAEQRAGFWNSRLSAHQRVIFTEPRLLSWQMDAISTIVWFVLPSLFLPLILETATRGLRLNTPNETTPLRAIVSAWSRWQLWLTIGLVSVIATRAFEVLTTHHYIDSPRAELLNAALRLTTLYAILVALALITLAIVAELLSQATRPITER